MIRSEVGDVRVEAAPRTPPRQIWSTLPPTQPPANTRHMILRPRRQRAPVASFSSRWRTTSSVALWTASALWTPRRRRPCPSAALSPSAKCTARGPTSHRRHAPSSPSSASASRTQQQQQQQHYNNTVTARTSTLATAAAAAASANSRVG